MGKYIRKCKRIGEIAVMEVSEVGGVRTRARALALATARRRKVSGGKLNVSPSLAWVRSRREGVVTTENSVSPATSDNAREKTVANNSRCSSPISDHAPASCCSSNGSSSSLKFADLERKSIAIETSTYDFDRRERREMTPSSELPAKSAELESTARPSEANSRRRSPVKKRPSEAELEEFFSAAEKDMLKRFTKKYNFDFVNGVPLEGRYKWARLNQGTMK